jgi:hypothetical protein
MSEVDERSRWDRAGTGGEPSRERAAGRPGEAAPADGASRGPVGPGQFPGEVRGPKGPEPTRFGDWEKGGRCFDF